MWKQPNIFLALLYQRLNLPPKELRFFYLLIIMRPTQHPHGDTHFPTGFACNINSLSSLFVSFLFAAQPLLLIFQFVVDYSGLHKKGLSDSAKYLAHIFQISVGNSRTEKENDRLQSKEKGERFLLLISSTFYLSSLSGKTRGFPLFSKNIYETKMIIKWGKIKRRRVWEETFSRY